MKKFNLLNKLVKFVQTEPELTVGEPLSQPVFIKLGLCATLLNSPRGPMALNIRSSQEGSFASHFQIVIMQLVFVYKLEEIISCRKKKNMGRGSLSHLHCSVPLKVSLPCMPHGKGSVWLD